MTATHTDILKFRKPALGDQGWDVDINDNTNITEVVLSAISKGNYVKNSLIPSDGGGLQVDYTAGSVYVNGVSHDVSASNKTCTDNIMNWLYVNSSGVMQISTSIPTGEFVPIAFIDCSSSGIDRIATLTPRLSAGLAESEANTNITSLGGLTTPLSVEQGGIGVSTLMEKGVLVGNGTGGVQATAAGSDGQVLTANPSGNPTFQDPVSEVGDAAVSQAKLKTSTGGTSVLGTGWISYNLPGGEYGYYFLIKSDSGGLSFAKNTDSGASSTSYASPIKLKQNVAGKYTHLQQRYVTSSGEVFWIFFLRDSSTRKILAVWAAPDHPSFGNGGKPVIVFQPFNDVVWNAEKNCYALDGNNVEIIVSNPSKKQVAMMLALRDVDNDSIPDRCMMQVILQDYLIDDDSTPIWPTTPVTVGLPNDYEAMPYGSAIDPVKKVIPRPAGILCKSLIYKDSPRGQELIGGAQ